MRRQVITNTALPGPNIYFSDFFQVDPVALEEYGAFDVSLVNDLPLFVDPFLLFNSDNPAYRALHDEMITYLRFLRDKSLAGGVNRGLLQAWYEFGEVKQNWLGFSLVGNSGSGLGPDFSRALHDNLGSVFRTFGQEQVTRGSHLEKLCLIGDRVGRDNISDFTTNLIKAFLLDYTQAFARQHLQPHHRRWFTVPKVRFNYRTEMWASDRYELPALDDDFVLLTPKDILTRDETWINRRDLINNFEQVAAAVPDEQLRAQLSNYLYAQLSRDPTMTQQEREKEKRRAIIKTIEEHPEVIEHYIREKEDDGDQARDISDEKVAETDRLFVRQLRSLIAAGLVSTGFYQFAGDTLEEARDRVRYLKHWIEDRDGYRVFYLDGKPVHQESTLQLLFALTWRGTPSDVNREVNNGRGPVDFKVSRGSKDASLVEFKLASNTQLRRNLTNQVPVYEEANETRKSIKVICYFTEHELAKVQAILEDLGIDDDPDIVLIDARADNKPSASKA